MEEIKKENPKSNDTSLVDKAELVAKRLEDANKKQEELMLAQQEMRARDILGGRSSGNIEVPKPDPVKEKKEKIKAYWQNSAISKAVEKYVDTQ